MSLLFLTGSFNIVFYTRWLIFCLTNVHIKVSPEINCTYLEYSFIWILLFQITYIWKGRYKFYIVVLNMFKISDIGKAKTKMKIFNFLSITVALLKLKSVEYTFPFVMSLTISHIFCKLKSITGILFQNI